MITHTKKIKLSQKMTRTLYLEGMSPFCDCYDMRHYEPLRLPRFATLKHSKPNPEHTTHRPILSDQDWSNIGAICRVCWEAAYYSCKKNIPR